MAAGPKERWRGDIIGSKYEVPMMPEQLDCREH